MVDVERRGGRDVEQSHRLVGDGQGPRRSTGAERLGLERNDAETRQAGFVVIRKVCGRLAGPPGQRVDAPVDAPDRADCDRQQHRDGARLDHDGTIHGFTRHSHFRCPRVNQLSSLKPGTRSNSAISLVTGASARARGQDDEPGDDEDDVESDCGQSVASQRWRDGMPRALSRRVRFGPRPSPVRWRRL